jgi:diguanylate cyclase (GGDEF)-like protein
VLGFAVLLAPWLRRSPLGGMADGVLLGAGVALVGLAASAHGLAAATAAIQVIAGAGLVGMATLAPGGLRRLPVALRWAAAAVATMTVADVIVLFAGGAGAAGAPTRLMVVPYVAAHLGIAAALTHPTLHVRPTAAIELRGLPWRPTWIARAVLIGIAIATVPVALAIAGRTGRIVEPALLVGAGAVGAMAAARAAHLVSVAGQRIMEAEAAATRDELTGLLNGRGFLPYVQEVLDLGLNAHLAYMDLDGFKKVNDVHGHAAGDRVLAVVAERLLEGFRDDDVVARLHGDEFVVLIRHLPFNEVEAVAERCRRLVRQPIAVRSEDGLRTILVHISLSIGIARAKGSTAADAVITADLAMYVAKRNGKDGIHSLDDISGGW